MTNLDVIARPDVVRTSASELVGAHAGEAQSLVEEKLADAKGGVLFIDEAY